MVAGEHGSHGDSVQNLMDGVSKLEVASATTQLLNLGVTTARIKETMNHGPMIIFKLVIAMKESSLMVIS